MSEFNWRKSAAAMPANVTCSEQYGLNQVPRKSAPRLDPKDLIPQHPWFEDPGRRTNIQADCLTIVWGIGGAQLCANPVPAAIQDITVETHSSVR